MEYHIEELVKSYELGRITRRALIRALAGTVLTGTAFASRQSRLEGVSINHVGLKVSDARRSTDFYHQLLGLPIQQQDATGADLGIGNSFLGIGQTATGAKPAIDHFCVGIKGFNMQSATASLKERGIQPEVLHGVQLYFRDPDGIRVQVSASDYVYKPS